MKERKIRIPITVQMPDTYHVDLSINGEVAELDYTEGFPETDAEEFQLAAANTLALFKMFSPELIPNIEVDEEKKDIRLTIKGTTEALVDYIFSELIIQKFQYTEDVEEFFDKMKRIMVNRPRGKLVNI